MILPLQQERYSMLARFGMSAAALAVLFASVQADAEECKLGRYASIDLIGPATRSPVIGGTINGKPVNFAVDTGGAWSMLPPALADGMPTQPMPKGVHFSDAADASIDSVVTADQLGFGPVKLSKVQFLKAGWATLGANILHSFDVEIDPVERKLLLFKHKDCDGAPAYWPHSDLAEVPFRVEGLDLIQIDVKLDGKTVEALIDTGAEASELDERVARNTFDIVLGSPDTEHSQSGVALTGKSFEQYRHQFGKLEIGNVEIDHPWLRLGVHDHSFFNPGAGPPLILGMSTLAPFHMFIAYKERKLYLTTVQGDLAAGRKPAAGASPGDTLAELNLQELLESADNAIKAGNAGRARAYLDRAVQLAPGDPEALAARAEFLESQHDAAGAKADFDKLATLPLPTAEDYLMRSAFFRETKELGRALDDANAAVQRAPQFAPALNSRCWVQAIMGRLAPALADCNAALALQPKSSTALDSRGFINLKSGRLDAAIADYDAALAVNGKSASSLYGRSLAKRGKGDLAGADADLAAARALAPDIDKTFGS